ncbi:hypothetical protein Tco_1412389, partial [Tanacetum coccineum]
VVYVIEFQKRGLPQAHILLWLEEQWKCKTHSKIDDIILAELPSLTDDPEGYKVVPIICYMDHVEKMPDMQHARSMGNAQNISLKLSYQKHSLMKKGTLIIVEWIIRSKAIKYLFKYLNKGTDRATIVIEENVKNEATLATETVAELSFHLPNQNTITMRDSESLQALLQREGIDVTMFTDWFELDKHDPVARTLTYVGILKYYVWMLLNVVRRVQGFKELITVNNRICPLFKEACFAYGLC